MTDSYAVAQAQIIQNTKMHVQDIRNDMGRADAKVPGNPEIVAHGTVLVFELVYGTRSSSNDDYESIEAEDGGPDDYLLGKSCVNGSLRKGQTESEWWDDHDILGVAKTMAQTNLKGTGTMKDTFPVIRGGKTSYHYTNPDVPCPRNAFLRARLPTSEDQARKANRIHQANPPLPGSRYTLYAEPVDLRYLGYTRTAAEEIRSRFEQNKMDSNYDQHYTPSSLRAMLRINEGLTDTFLYTSLMLEVAAAQGAENDDSWNQLLRACKGIRAFFRNPDQERKLVMQQANVRAFAPNARDFMNLEEEAQVFARTHMNGFQKLANGLSEWRWRDSRTIFGRSLMPASAGSGRPVDLMVIQNAY